MSSGTERANDVIQATIKVHGRVQQVGYRRKVNHFAQGLDLRGFVMNLKDPSTEDDRYQPVGIVCQGPREKVEIFLELIEVVNGFIRVERVDVNFKETFDMVFPNFYIHREEAEDEIGPRMDSAIKVLERMDRHILDGNKDLKEAFMRGFENLGEKIDRTNESIANMNENLGEKMDRGTEINLRRFDRIEEKHHAAAEGLKGTRGAEKGFAVEEERGEYGGDGAGSPDGE